MTAAGELALPSAARPGRALAAGARRLVRGHPADPAWSRPALLGVGALAGLLMCWSLTSNGYGNPYYAEAVAAGTQSWSAFFSGALDVSGYVGYDKTPLAIWMMALSGRLFGFSSLSMLLPNALCGLVSVLVLHNVVKRTLGPRAAIVAALMLALSPVAVLMARFNNPDALLVLLLVCSAWAAVRAIESGRTRHIVLCGVLVGLAFNTKMLQAYLVVPALALPFLVAAPGTVRRRLTQLAAGGAAMLAVSAAWVTTMSLIPASQRPWVADTTSNSWWDLIVNANGLDRASGGAAPGGGGLGGDTGVLRLFNDQIAGQIAWLLPLAAVGLLVGLWLRRRAPRTDPARASYLLWGTWALVGAIAFSSLTVLHPYYMSALAPAVAALAAGGVVALWDRSRTNSWAAGLLAASVLGNSVLAFALLDRTPSFAPWLRWTVLGLGIAAAVAVLVWRLGPRSGRRLAFAAIAGTAAAILAGPAAYSIATVGRHYGAGGPPAAGPATANAGFAGSLPGGGPPAALAALLGGPGARGGPPAGLAAILGGKAPGGTDKRLTGYLLAHRGGARYLVAAEGSLTAAPIALSTRQPVITMGGFMGGDPAPTASELRGLVRSGQVRYVLLGGLGNLIAAGGPQGSGGSRRDRAAVQARQRWVTANCRAVSYGGSSRGRAQSLYDCSGASAV